MKIALYFEDGTEQVILTPENDSEKLLLAQLDGGVLSVKRGQFYWCQGGWVRQGSEHQQESFMLLVRDKSAEA